MTYVSILTSDRELDPELWAVIWQAEAPQDLNLLCAYNLAGNKRVFIWESDSISALQFMDNFNQIGKLETYPAFDRSDGWRAAFLGDLESFEKSNRESGARLGLSSEQIERRIESSIELRQGARDSVTREAARKFARGWVERRTNAT